ncbi:NAD+ synthase [candidate division WOR-3 bacterium]|nr:NAD+ synthase [candidate division WOR-3 bacterium]
MRIALAQLNPIVGDLAGNIVRVQKTLARVAPNRPDLVVFPELFLVGYPPRDLISRRWFVEKAEAALARVIELSRQFPDTGVVVGAAVRNRSRSGKGLDNAAVLVAGGRELHRQAKTLLPSYDVFDEARYFDPAAYSSTVEFRGERLGLTICEDAWNVPELLGRRAYDRDPVAELAGQGATLLINISASPFTVGKESLRYRLLSGHCCRHGVPLVFVNQVGANDELVFDGRSMALDRSGLAIDVLPGFDEAVTMTDTAAHGSDGRFQPQELPESVHDALVLGIRDYVRKCGFATVVLGLSGGIDSAVVCSLAVAALGKENVLGVTMPSEYSSQGSVTDSRELAGNLGVRLTEVPIAPVCRQYLVALKDEFRGLAPDVAEENLQARVRGNILMAISNKHGHLVLSTGNKSELAVGYCTLYGDMSGGLCVLADVPKTMVYQLARHINRKGEVIPRAIIDKPPSAELRPNQTDQDTLPPYDVLDEIIRRYVDEGESPDQIEAAGFRTETVRWVVRAVNSSEYKRRQAAPGIRVTSRAFGIGWRMPVAARYST